MIPWRRKWQPTPVFLPGKFHGCWSLVGYLLSMGSQRIRYDWATSLLHFTIIFITFTIVWSQVNSREGTQLHPSTENWIKVCWTWPHPSEQDSVSPSVSLSHQEASISFLSLSIRKMKVKVKYLSHVQLFVTPWTHLWDSPGKNTRVGCHFPLQGIFPTQELNPGLWHCRQML